MSARVVHHQVANDALMLHEIVNLPLIEWSFFRCAIVMETSITVLKEHFADF